MQPDSPHEKLAEVVRLCDELERPEVAIVAIVGLTRFTLGDLRALLAKPAPVSNLTQRISGSIGLMNDSNEREIVARWWRAVSPILAVSNPNPDPTPAPPIPDALRSMRSHKWTGRQGGGNPAEAGSCEWVRYCDVCGMEDTCEDPLPPCPGVDALPPSDALRQVEAALRAATCRCTRRFRCPDCDGPIENGQDQFEGAYICTPCNNAFSYHNLPIRDRCSRCASIEALPALAQQMVEAQARLTNEIGMRVLSEILLEEAGVRAFSGERPPDSDLSALLRFSMQETLDTQAALTDSLREVEQLQQKHSTLAQQLQEGERRCSLLMENAGKLGKQLIEFGDEVNRRGEQLTRLREALAVAENSFSNITELPRIWPDGDTAANAAIEIARNAIARIAALSTTGTKGEAASLPEIEIVTPTTENRGAYGRIGGGRVEKLCYFCGRGKAEHVGLGLCPTGTPGAEKGSPE